MIIEVQLPKFSAFCTDPFSPEILTSIVPIIENAGGKVLVNHIADEIIIENGKAIGVRVTHKKGKENIQKEQQN